MQADKPLCDIDAARRQHIKGLQDRRVILLHCFSVSGFGVPRLSRALSGWFGYSANQRGKTAGILKDIAIQHHSVVDWS